MKTGYDLINPKAPLDERCFVKYTYCLNCDKPIQHDDRERNKEYCNAECQEEHESIMKMVIE